jgi:hypothetical protein
MHHHMQEQAMKKFINGAHHTEGKVEIRLMGGQ